MKSNAHLVSFYLCRYEIKCTSCEFYQTFRKICRLNFLGGTHLNSLRPRQNGCHFADDIFKCIFLNKNEWISLKISLKFVPKVPINNIPALVQIMAWRRPGDKPLSKPMIVSLLTHICVTRPQWVKIWIYKRHPISCPQSQIAKFMGPTWGPSVSYRPQMGPMLAPWILLSGEQWDICCKNGIEHQVMWNIITFHAFSLFIWITWASLSTVERGY